MICYVCKQDLSEDAFSPGIAKKPQPSRHICRKCNNERCKESNRKNPDRRKKYDASYEERRTERRKARLAITCAIKYRGFEKQPCQVCGREDDVEGHHLSYLEKDWLTVVWLCPVCHKGAHHGTVDVSNLQTYTAPPILGRWGELAKANSI